MKTRHKVKRVSSDELSLAEYDASRQVESGGGVELPIFGSADLLWTPAAGDGSATLEARREVAEGMPAGWVPPSLMLLILPMGTHWLFFGSTRCAVGIFVGGATVRCVCRNVMPLVPAGIGEMRPDGFAIATKGFYTSDPVFGPLGGESAQSIVARGPGQLGARFLASLSPSGG